MICSPTWTDSSSYVAFQRGGGGPRDSGTRFSSSCPPRGLGLFRRWLARFLLHRRAACDQPEAPVDDGLPPAGGLHWYTMLLKHSFYNQRFQCANCHGHGPYTPVSPVTQSQFQASTLFSPPCRDAAINFIPSKPPAMHLNLSAYCVDQPCPKYKQYAWSLDGRGRAAASVAQGHCPRRRRYDMFQSLSILRVGLISDKTSV